MAEFIQILTFMVMTNVISVETLNFSNVCWSSGKSFKLITSLDTLYNPVYGTLLLSPHPQNNSYCKLNYATIFLS